MKRKHETPQRQEAGIPSINPSTGKHERGYFIYGSDPLSHREARRKAKQSLKQGIEPEPKYREGKSWRD